VLRVTTSDPRCGPLTELLLLVAHRAATTPPQVDDIDVMPKAAERSTPTVCPCWRVGSCLLFAHTMLFVWLQIHVHGPGIAA
jgi:hypothetical protein